MLRIDWQRQSTSGAHRAGKRSRAQVLNDLVSGPTATLARAWQPQHVSAALRQPPCWFESGTPRRGIFSCHLVSCDVSKRPLVLAFFKARLVPFEHDAQVERVKHLGKNSMIPLETNYHLCACPRLSMIRRGNYLCDIHSFQVTSRQQKHVSAR